MERIKTYFRNIQPFALLAGGLLLVASISAGLGLWHHQLGAQTKSQPAATVSSADSDVNNPNSSQPGTKPSTENNSSNNQSNSQTGQAHVAGSNTQNYESSSTSVATHDTSNDSANFSSNSSDTTDNQTKQITVTLSIYNRGAHRLTGQVQLANTSNQCDVLRQARDTGLISSLTMGKSSYGMGVYIIDGVGTTNDIWWVYTVNGQSPSSCDRTPINPGDDIDWNYIK